jgi:hypothetical protein
VVSLFLFLFLFQISLKSLWVTFLVLDTTGFDASRFLFLPIVQEVFFLRNRLQGSMGNSFLFVVTVVSLTKSLLSACWNATETQHLYVCVFG